MPTLHQDGPGSAKAGIQEDEILEQDCSRFPASAGMTALFLITTQSPKAKKINGGRDYALVAFEADLWYKKFTDII